MKTIALCFGLVVAFASSAQAQLFRPETVRGAVLGGVTGAVIGHNDGRHGWEGAAYGAAAGALIGSWVGESRERHLPPAPRRVYGPVVYREPVWHRTPVYRHPHRHQGIAVRSVWHPAVVYRERPYEAGRYRPGTVRTGVLLGGLAGAIIGHNNDRRGWEGAAYGAGAGWLLGSIIEHSRQRAGATYTHETESMPQVYRLPEAAPTTVIHHHYYGNAHPGAMSPANGLFGR